VPVVFRNATPLDSVQQLCIHLVLRAHCCHCPSSQSKDEDFYVRIQPPLKLNGKFSKNVIRQQNREIKLTAELEKQLHQHHGSARPGSHSTAAVTAVLLQGPELVPGTVACHSCNPAGS